MDHLHCFSQQVAPHSYQGDLRKVVNAACPGRRAKRSAARVGALTAQTRAKAWGPDLDPVDVGKGYPSLKEDGSEFGNDDLEP